MKTEELLKDLHYMFDQDALLDEDINLLDVLDYMAILGLPGASHTYFYVLGATEEQLKQFPPKAKDVGHKTE